MPIYNDGRAVFLGYWPHQFSRLASYLDIGKEHRIFKGEEIDNKINNNDDPFLFYILQGKFKLRATYHNSTPIDFTYCTAGNFMWLNTPSPLVELCSLSKPQAMENSVIVSFTKAQFHQLIANDPLLFDEYLDGISGYCLQLKQRVLMTAGLSASQRLLQWLDKLCLGTPRENDGSYMIECDLTQQQISNLLFIHVTTCNKLFAKLASENIARKTKRQIIVYRHDRIKYYLENELDIKITGNAK